MLRFKLSPSDGGTGQGDGLADPYLSPYLVMTVLGESRGVNLWGMITP
ncbi:MAG: hypothetical protein KGQ93_00650 [Cyanobacteria bacterium REEB459]|nr:hypothetical protein [Cyanobacteria bacterium REEB459]